MLLQSIWEVAGGVVHRRLRLSDGEAAAIEESAWGFQELRATDSIRVEIVGESVEESFEPHRDLVHRNPVVLSALAGSVPAAYFR
ncbi:hypothetical protein [Rhodococcus sp. 24CO]|uniref:hypothetical protein n=1 Tax=Rhodococcus sp. 24CO TaxID=3117460 RepID=UPI003D33E77A